MAFSAVGEQVYISVPECGISGNATVLRIDDCPPLAPRPGPGFQIVTGTFQHAASQTLDISVEGESKPIGTSPNHPIWSVDREAFVRADSLSVGEQLQTLNGIARVTSITARGPPEPVYNLEVQVKHTYFVADRGVLVHNGTPCPVGASSAIPDSYMNKRHFVNMEPARDLVGTTLNASGEVRNANYFWRELIDRQPKMFSKSNRYKIEELGLSPKVDSTWIKYNPTHQSFKGDVLHHHHIDHGKIAVPLPKTIHEQWTSILH
jgi:hypothetical protein